MRVAEKEMIAAIRAGKRKVVQNTRVRHYDTGAPGYNVGVELHGHLIARLHRTDAGSVTLMSVTLAGWPTPTTRSRLNALCQAFGLGGYSRFSQEKGRQYYTDRTTGFREIGDAMWIDVPTV